MPSTADQLCATLAQNLSYESPDTSFSPLYSDVGLGFSGSAGISSLYLHYNRKTRVIGPDFVRLSSPVTHTVFEALGVRRETADGTLDVAFFARNAFVLDAVGGGLNLSGAFVPEMSNVRVRALGETTWFIEAELPTGDPRDPDERVPFSIGVRLLRGAPAEGSSVTRSPVFVPGPERRVTLALVVRVLDIDVESTARTLRAAPAEVADARAATRAWLDRALGTLRIDAVDPNERRVLALAAFGLLMNSCEAPGMLAGRIAAFPSRGGYPTHYLWDSCFQNLALEHMEPRLAEDSLLLLTENQRVDGKIGHFVCSTWIRPHESQPPLVGWAAWRLVSSRDDRTLAGKLLPALERNTRWWLTQRMSSTGLVRCTNPLETGWDDTPRLDDGEIIPCCMNAYLLLQMQASTRIARFVDDTELAARLEERADEFAAALVRVLYDEVDVIFRDRLVADDSLRSLETPACFLPLLCDLPLPEERVREMIERHLLDPTRFFGEIPFPSVSYRESAYDHGKWWRGPTWMPIAWLMLEVLARYGYHRERRIALERLHRVMLADGRLSELFDSQTGAGMGQVQQGWTAAIFLAMNEELRGSGRGSALLMEACGPSAASSASASAARETGP